MNGNTAGAGLPVFLMLANFVKIRALPEDRRISFARLASCDQIKIEIDWKHLPAVLREAETNVICYEEVRYLSVLALRRGIEIPAVLASWIADVVEGDRKPPAARPGKSWSANWIRDLWICQEVARIVREDGLWATRSAASPPGSACDAVADQSGMTYEAVAMVWRHRRRYRGLIDWTFVD